MKHIRLLWRWTIHWNHKAAYIQDNFLGLETQKRRECKFPMIKLLSDDSSSKLPIKHAACDLNPQPKTRRFGKKLLTMMFQCGRPFCLWKSHVVFGESTYCHLCSVPQRTIIKESGLRRTFLFFGLHAVCYYQIWVFWQISWEDISLMWY